jgi:Na+-translocating ferredoxin:NAD+ oxidoreductase subunit B
MPEPKPARPSAPTAAAIDALLPQTQCERCGHPGCLPYAEALAAGTAPLNQCPPGGAALIGRLATLLALRALPLDERHAGVATGLVAFIEPAACIGCARCLPPCPTDAILGAQRSLHTVIADWCTGCELCLASCPVDCIRMQPRTASQPEPLPRQSRERHQAHLGRVASRAAARAAELHTLKLAPAREAQP